MRNEDREHYFIEDSKNVLSVFAITLRLQIRTITGLTRFLFEDSFLAPRQIHLPVYPLEYLYLTHHGPNN